MTVGNYTVGILPHSGPFSGRRSALYGVINSTVRKGSTRRTGGTDYWRGDTPVG